MIYDIDLVTLVIFCFQMDKASTPPGPDWFDLFPEKRLSSLRWVRRKQAECLSNLQSENLKPDIRTLIQHINQINGVDTAASEREMNEALKTLDKVTEELKKGRKAASYSETNNLFKCFKEAKKLLKVDTALRTLEDLDRRTRRTLDCFITAWEDHKKLLFDVIKTQRAQVRMMKIQKAGKSAVEEAEKRLDNLKQMWREDLEKEWSNVTLDGPTVLTTNVTRESEMEVEIKELVKQYMRAIG